MASQYIVHENQTALWNAIQVAPAFKSANLGRQSKDEWFKDIIHRFYTQLVDSGVKSLSRPDLQDMNKKTISFMVADLKQRIPSSQVLNNPTLHNSKIPQLQNTVVGSPMDRLKSETVVREGSLRTESLEKQFSSRQQVYTNILQPPPPEIDFRMVEKDEPITDLDKLIQQHMNDRERDLQVYVPTNTPPSLNNTKLSIAESIDNSVLGVVDALTTHSPKSVSWNDTNTEPSIVSDFQKFKEEVWRDLEQFKDEIRALLSSNIRVDEPPLPPTLMEARNETERWI